jgi:hypothetical protein
MKKIQMIFPCKIKPTEMQDMGEGKFFCHSCYTNVIDLRNNVVPIQNLKCGIFNITNIEFKPIHVQIPAFKIARISVLALVGLIGMPETNAIAQDSTSIQSLANSMSKLKFPITIRGNVMDNTEIRISGAIINLFKDGKFARKSSTTDTHGSFVLELNENDITQGSFELFVSFPGYISETYPLENLNQNRLLNIELKPIIPENKSAEIESYSVMVGQVDAGGGVSIRETPRSSRIHNSSKKSKKSKR